MLKPKHVKQLVAGVAVLAGIAAIGLTTMSADASTSASTPQRLNMAQPAVTPDAASWSYRACWDNVQNGNQLVLSAPVSAGQAVAVTASELASNGQEFQGSATIVVQNVSVTQGSVTTRLDVEWPHGISICLHYIA